jgi:hypothetical protein
MCVVHTLVLETSNIGTLSGSQMPCQDANMSEPVVEWRCAYANDRAVCPLRFAFKHLFRLQIGRCRGYAFACASQVCTAFLVMSLRPHPHRIVTLATGRRHQGRYVPEPGRHEPERLVPALYPRSWRAGGHGYRGDR